MSAPTMSGMLFPCAAGEPPEETEARALEAERDQPVPVDVDAGQPGLPLPGIDMCEPCSVCGVRSWSRPCASRVTAEAIGCPGVHLLRCVAERDAALRRAAAAEGVVTVGRAWRAKRSAFLGAQTDVARSELRVAEGHLVAAIERSGRG